jgi:hypothetical protein
MHRPVCLLLKSFFRLETLLHIQKQCIQSIFEKKDLNAMC